MGIGEDVLTRQAGKLVAWRKGQEPKLSQEAAAKKIGATQSAWAAWERAAKAPDSYYAGKIEKLTRGRVRASGWAYPRHGTAAAEIADDSGTDVTAPAAKAS